MEGGEPRAGEEHVVVAPLEGVTVIDLGHFIAAPLAAQWLGALGADVIRVERPGGDLSWKVPPFIGPDGAITTDRRAQDQISLNHLKRGRGKRSVVLDYRSEDGRELLYRLLERADVLIENFRPSDLAPLGLDPDLLCERYRRLIYCSVSGFGLSGPKRDWPAMDIAVQAASGFMGRTGFPDGPPVKTGATVGDQVPAAFAVIGILAALRQRETTGRGQVVDVAMAEVLSAMVWDEPVDWYKTRDLPERWGNSDPRGGPLNVYRCSDGWIALVVASDRQFQALCELMDREDLGRVGKELRDRVANLKRIDDALSQWLRTRATEQAAASLRSCGIPASPVTSPFDIAEDEQVRQRRSLVSLEHPASPGVDSGFLGPALPVLFSQHQPRLTPAELLGESTDAVFEHYLGLTHDDLARYRGDGIFGTEANSEEAL